MTPRHILRSIASAIADGARLGVRAGVELVYGVVFAGGLGLVGFGAWLVYEPLGFLLAGGLLCGGVLLHVWRS